MSLAYGGAAALRAASGNSLSPWRQWPVSGTIQADVRDTTQAPPASTARKARRVPGGLCDAA
ncbi:hypothetical protein E3O45_05740 [Cryobacterium sp. TMS1-20-1]|uniref:hypothetical protein n=1 Tax=Cryobacterium sp. TMS1-20-1 TaxID=1259223 RepID=UPI00106CD33E|nr:hypothetical protein [Cryobacterium sp. TMS1-20-1]TFC78121.1 hypothetical protein E3O45_05740 [Cryobacterium sp. TMS1-20-1]